MSEKRKVGPKKTVDYLNALARRLVWLENRLAKEPSRERWGWDRIELAAVQWALESLDPDDALREQRVANARARYVKWLEKKTSADTEFGKVWNGDAAKAS